MKLILDTYRVKSELNQKGMTQTDLANKLGISRQAAWVMLAQPRSVGLRRLAALAGALEIDPKALLLVKE